MLSNREITRLRAMGVVLLIFVFGLITVPATIVNLTQEKAGDFVGAAGTYRYTDAKYVYVNADGSVRIDKDAPVSQWPKAYRLYWDEHRQLHVTYFPDPVRFERAAIN